MLLSAKAKSLKPSPTLGLAAKAKELALKGNDVVSLTVGEPDWSTFEKASQAGIDAIKSGFTKYTVVPGIPELREAIRFQTKQEIGIDYPVGQISVTSGAKYILFAAFQMLLDEGDEVLVPAPYWVSYPTMIELAGGKPVIVPSSEENGFKITARDLAPLVTKKTKAIVLCSPSNPTGMVYSKEELKSLGEELKKYPDVLIISDDIYNRLVFSGDLVAPHILQIFPELKDRTLVVNGVSKTYAMTGWRIGWACGPDLLIKAMNDFESQSTSNPASMAQKAALVAIKDCQNDILGALKNLRSRRDLALELAHSIPSIDVQKPEGAFYLWLNIKKTNMPSKEFCQNLLEKYFVAAVPGAEFGMEGYIRVSYVVSEKDLHKAFQRIKEFCQSIV